MAEKYVKLDDIIETLENEWGYEGMREDLYNLPTADVQEKKDCEKCIHFGKHATEYPCSHCRNCYTDKFQPNDTRTPQKEG